MTLPATEAFPAVPPQPLPNSVNDADRKFRILKPLPIGEYRLFRKFKGLNPQLWHPNNRKTHADVPATGPVDGPAFIEGQYYTSDELAVRFLRKDEFDLEKTTKSLTEHLNVWLPKYTPERMRLGGKKNEQLRALNAEGFYRYMGRDRTTGWPVMAGDARCFGAHCKNADSEAWLRYYVFIAAQLEKIFDKDEKSDVELLQSVFDANCSLNSTSLPSASLFCAEQGDLIDISNVDEAILSNLLLPDTIDEKQRQHDFYYAQRTYVKNMKIANDVGEVERQKFFVGCGDKFKNKKLESGVLMPDRRCKWLLNGMGMGPGALKRPYFVTKMSEVLSDYYPDTMSYFVMMNVPMGKMIWGIIKGLIPAKAQLRACLNAPAKDSKDGQWLAELIPDDINILEPASGWKAGQGAHWTGYPSPNFAKELGIKECPNVCINSRRSTSKIDSDTGLSARKSSVPTTGTPNANRATGSPRTTQFFSPLSRPATPRATAREY